MRTSPSEKENTLSKFITLREIRAVPTFLFMISSETVAVPREDEPSVRKRYEVAVSRSQQGGGGRGGPLGSSHVPESSWPVGHEFVLLKHRCRRNESLRGAKVCLGGEEPIAPRPRMRSTSAYAEIRALP